MHWWSQHVGERNASWETAFSESLRCVYALVIVLDQFQTRSSASFSRGRDLRMSLANKHITGMLNEKRRNRNGSKWPGENSCREKRIKRTGTLELQKSLYTSRLSAVRGSPARSQRDKHAWRRAARARKMIWTSDGAGSAGERVLWMWSVADGSAAGPHVDFCR